MARWLVGWLVGLEARQILRLFAPICHSGKVTPKNNGVIFILLCQAVNGRGNVNILKTKSVEKSKNIKMVITGEAV
jgi:hypothetical protein